MKMNLASKYMLLACMAILIVNSVTGIMLVAQSRDALLTQINTRMKEISDTAADALDGDMLRAVTRDDADSDRYSEIYDTLNLFKNNTEITYIYTIQQTGVNEFAFIIDPDPIAPGAFGDPVVTTEALCAAAGGVTSVDATPFEDQWGRFYSSYSPVYDSSGEIAGIVGVDFDAAWLDSQLSKNTRTILFSSLIAVILCIIAAMLISRKLSSRFAVIYDGLESLTGEIERLNKNITDNPDFQGLLDEAQTEERDVPVADEGMKDPGNDEIGALVGKLNNMTREMDQYLAFVHKQAYTDPLTGAGNKTAYLNYVKELNSQISEGNAAFSLIIVDIHGLKGINDSFGHEYGDIVICDTASILKKSFGTDHVYRMGGDEFIAVLDGNMSDRDIERLFDDVDTNLSKYNSEVSDEMKLHLNKGASSFIPGSDREVREVFKRADEAMYRDKVSR